MGDEWCTAPTVAQAFRWFREKHMLHGEVMLVNGNIYTWECYKITDKKQIGVDRMTAHLSLDSNSFNTYEEAELACLKELIKIVKLNEAN